MNVPTVVNDPSEFRARTLSDKADRLHTPERREIAVVIVNWNAGGDLARCVEDLRSGVAGHVEEIMVVDNGSSDDSLELLERPDDVVVIETGRNLGFAAGANLGAGRCRSANLLFLNPDMRLLPDGITVAASYLENHPGVGIVGALLFDEHGDWQPSSGHLGVLSHLLLDTRPWRRPPRTSRRVGWVHGAFLMIPRTLFERLGGFDESFFMYGEDMDICARARGLGFETAIVTDARAVHFGNRSGARRFGAARTAEIVKAEMRFYARATGRGGLLLFRVVAIVKLAVKATAYVFLGELEKARRTGGVMRECVVFTPPGRAE